MQTGLAEASLRFRPGRRLWATVGTIHGTLGRAARLLVGTVPPVGRCPCLATAQPILRESPAHTVLQARMAWVQGRRLEVLSEDTVGLRQSSGPVGSQGLRHRKTRLVLLLQCRHRRVSMRLMAERERARAEAWA